MVNIFQQNNPGPERLGFDKPEIDLFLQLWEHRLAAAEDNGVEVEAVFVDQAQAHEARRQGRPADGHVLAGTGFQPVDLGGNVALE